MGSLAELLQHPLCELVQPKQHVVLLPHNISIGEALRTLAKHDILSAPLVMYPDLEEVGSTEGVNLSPQLLGWIDVGDILKGFMAFLDTTGANAHAGMLQLMTLLERHGPDFADRMLITVQGREDRELVYQAEGGATSVLTAIRDLFLRRVGGETRVVHRLALFDAHGDITAVISQMDVARWLLAHTAQLGGLGGRSLEALGMLTGKPPVEAVNPHDPTLLAFSKMAEAGVSGAPVITDGGELIANLSVSDLRLLTPEHFGVLALPVAEFLALAHGTAYLGYAAAGSSPRSGGGRHARHMPFFASGNRPGGPAKGDIQVFAVGRAATLQEVLERLVANHIHRVYVTPDGGAVGVEAVVTITDILRVVAGVV